MTWRRFLGQCHQVVSKSVLTCCGSKISLLCHLSTQSLLGSPWLACFLKGCQLWHLFNRCHGRQPKLGASWSPVPVAGGRDISGVHVLKPFSVSLGGAELNLWGPPCLRGSIKGVNFCKHVKHEAPSPSATLILEEVLHIGCCLMRRSLYQQCMQPTHHLQFWAERVPLLVRFV
jgi:hypothetical protein